MPIRQLSIFLENRKGRLAAVVAMLADAGIDIRGLSIADTAEFGILRLIVDNVSKAEEVLNANGVVLHVNDVTAIEVDKNPGGLAKILALLNSSDINVEYMYTLAEPQNANPVLVLRFSNPKIARDILRNGGAILLEECELFNK